jgi:hypothetical protein
MRKQISNKLRFEVFKRDSFKCQYCGKSAPDVILNVDHLDPVKNGGDNDILNLITSCFECNNGKSANLLSDNSLLSKQKQQLDELNERRNQLQMLIEWKTILSDKSFEIDSIVKFFNNSCNANISLTEYGHKYFKQLLSKYSFEQILDAITNASTKYANLPPAEIINKISGVLDFTNASENDKYKMRVYGAIKNKFTGTSGYYKSNIINTNRMLKSIFSMVDGGLMCTYDDILKCVDDNRSYYDFMDIIEQAFNRI